MRKPRFEDTKLGKLNEAIKASRRSFAKKVVKEAAKLGINLNRFDQAFAVENLAFQPYELVLAIEQHRHKLRTKGTNGLGPGPVSTPKPSNMLGGPG